MSRASTAAIPNISSSTQSTLHDDARGREDKTPRRTGSHRADSSVKFHSHSPALSSPAPRASKTTEGINTTYSPDNDDNRSGDLLNGVGSDTSLASSVTSVFSANTKMSYPGQAASLHALTPLTSTDSSPPGKLPSPRSAKPSNETLSATIASSQSAPVGPPKNVTDTMTPVHTPPEAKISVRPTDGQMGERTVYDPALDSKLSDKAKRKAGPPIRRPIIEKVRDKLYCIP